MVVVIHGGFWRAPYDHTLMTALCAALAAHGAAAWNVEYRRIGDRGGAWPGTLLDVGAAADHVRVLARDHALDATRVVALGHSAGGHLATWLAARSRLAPGSALYAPDPLPLRAALSQAGVVDLTRAYELGLSINAVEQLLGGTPAAVPERYAAASPQALLPLGAPVVLLHGTADDTVPFAMSADYARAAQAAGDAVTLVPFPGAGHYELIDPATPEGRACVEHALRRVG
jgi:acetyl esterase/lipase